MLRRRGPAALVVVVLLLASHAPAAAQESTGSRLPAAYLTALASYRAGDLAAAFKKLREFGDADLVEITKRLQRRDVAAGAVWPRLLSGAILLHTEAFLIRAEVGDPLPGDLYVMSAHTLVRRLLKLVEDGEPGAGETERTLVRDWYLLMVAFQHGRAEMGSSRGFIAEALKSFPKDPLLTVARGSDHEMLSELSTGSVSHFSPGGQFLRVSAIDADDEREEAMRAFEQAVALAPDLLEARLRLGRLLYRRGDLDGAQRELDAARALASQNEVVYLVALFRGMVEARRGDFERADRFYAEAEHLFPQAQSAGVARAEAAYLAGRAAGAAATIQAVLRKADKDDPWWSYIMGEFWHFEARLAGIRKYVQQ
jgi:tetratricopeptide (TPR) repeat protein